MLADFKKERLADSWSSPLSAREQGMPGIIYTKRQTEVIKKKLQFFKVVQVFKVFPIVVLLLSFCVIYNQTTEQTDEVCFKV